ncbi:37S ribosomal protein S23 mitochondrial [Serendipita sp. 399]|nr:37S ribosomal protein S23 mitochondrial [Serendipita sp. 399]
MFQVKILIGLGGRGSNEVVRNTLDLDQHPPTFMQRQLSRECVRSLRGVSSKRELRTASRLLANVTARGGREINVIKSFTPDQTTGARKPTSGIDLDILLRDNADQSEMKELELDSVHPHSLGVPFAFPQKKPDPIRTFGIPRSVERDFNFFSKPFSIIRQSTLDLLALLEKSKDPEYKPRTVITGSHGTGKSYLLLQAVAHCIASNWLVLYIPRAIDTVDCTTPYTYDSRTQTFVQPVYSASLLRQIRDMGHPGLKTLTTTRDFNLERAPPGAPATGSPLIQLIEYGIREVSVAPFVLEALLAEFATQAEYPFLLAIDDFQALYGRSQYKTPQFVPIDTYHLSVPRLLLEYACGSRPIRNGALLGALSLYHTSYLPTTELYEALNLDLTHGRRPDAYTKRSAELQHYAKGLQPFRIPDKLDIREAAGLFDTLLKEKILHTVPSDQFFLSKYCESDGNPKEFVWRGLLSTLDT